MGAGRFRQALATGTAVLAGVLTIAALCGLYVREELARPASFADRALVAYDAPAVRQVVARKVVAGLIDRGSSNLISARPVLESAVQAIAGTAPFRAAVRRGTLESHQLLFDRGRDALVFSLADAGTIALSAVRSVSPEVAKRIPPRADVVIADTRGRPFATRSLDAAQRARRWGIVLPVLAVALLTAALVASTERRLIVARFGAAVGVAGIVAAVGLGTAKSLVIGSLDSSDTLPVEEIRAAAGAAWDAFLGDLSTLALILALVGWVVAAAARTATAPVGVGGRLKAALQPPAGRRGRVVRGATLTAVGLLVVLEPAVALRTGVFVAGAALLYTGVSELLALAERPQRTTRPARAAGALAATAVLTLGLAAGASALVLHVHASGSPQTPAAAVGCNGSRALCDRRLDEVLFPGTHNSESAADSRGWLLTNQRRAIPRQLSDGIRLFLMDPHYGRAVGGGVITDLQAEGSDANKAAMKLSPEARAAFDRLSPALRGGGGRGPREVFLCHTLCEIGATRMRVALDAFRSYLQRDRGAVVVMVLESYVQERDLLETFKSAGLADELVTLDRSRPLPTLGELVHANHRIVAFTEQRPSGQFPQLNDAFSFVQDTPLGARAPSEFSCDRFRGEAGSPLLMINHWIDRFPPPLDANREILTPAFLKRRIERCAGERGLPVSLIAVDFYDQGPFVETIRQLNASR